MIKTDNRFTVEGARSTTLPRGATAEAGFSRIPAIQDLDLPAPRGRVDVRGCYFDTEALVWVKKPKIRPVGREVVPTRTMTPENRPGPQWEFLDRKTRMVIWRVTAGDAADAETEFERLCIGYGYRLTDGMTRLVPVVGSDARERAGLTNTEVRRRLGL